MPKHVIKKHVYPCNLPLEEMEIPSVLSALFELNFTPTILCDNVGRIISINNTFKDLTGYDDLEVRYAPLSMLFDGYENKEIEYEQIFNEIIHNGGWKGTLWLRTKKGRLLALAAQFSAINKPNGPIQHIIGMYEMPSASDAEKFPHPAHHDMMTRLISAGAFLNRLEHAMYIVRENGSMASIFYMDIDNFETLNSRFGFETGDAILRRLSRILQQNLPAESSIARIKDDEFAFIVLDKFTQKDIHDTIEKVMDALEKDKIIGDILPSISFSIGAAIHPLSGDGHKELFDKARQCAKIAKERGGNRVVYHKKVG